MVPVYFENGAFVAKYFFDVQDDDTFHPDDVGMEFPSMEMVKAQASRTMGEIAKDVLPGSEVRTLAAGCKQCAFIFRYGLTHVMVTEFADLSNSDEARVEAAKRIGLLLRDYAGGTGKWM